jgi:DNA-binding response OmpR family regulator
MDELKRTLLLVDEDAAVLHTFTRIFERNGYCVVAAQDGKGAIEKLDNQNYDVAVIDFAVPDMDGTKLFSIIRKKSPKTLSVILNSELDPPVDIEDADVFVEKPAPPEKLLSLLDTKLRNRDLETQP